MTIANNVAAKLSVAFVAIAMMLSLVAPAQAQTAEELQAQIADLMATINALQSQVGAGDSMSSSDVCPYTWTRSLNMGDTGMDVMKLQQFLNADVATQVAAAGSAGSAGMETQYYGPATGAAVAKFQEMYRADILSPLGLVNSTTFFGPSTMAKANALCVSAPVDNGGDDGDDGDNGDNSDDSNELGNDEGDIESVSEVSADESSLEEGEEGGILAFEVEIEGDVEINRIDIFAEETGGANDDDADDYFVEASLWVDGDKVATLDVDDFDDDDAPYEITSGGNAYDYRMRFSGLDLVFEDGDEPEFQLAFEVVSRLDSDSINNGVWTAELDSIRFVDGQGFTGTDERADDDVKDTVSFDMEETAELDISDNSDNPDPTTLKIDDGDDESDEYDVLVFEIEEDNGVDVTIDDMTFQATTTGETDESKVIEEVILYQGSTELASETIGSDGDLIMFENLGIEIDGDATEEFTLAMIFKGSDDAGTGSDVTVELVSVDDAEDANGNDEGEMTIDISAGSETHTLRTVVPEVTDTSFSNDKAEDDQSGVISFEFTISAEDDDFDFGVANKAAVDGTSDDIRFTTTGTDLGIDVAAITKISGDATATVAGWTITDGEEATFVMDVTFTTVDSGDNGTYRVNVDTVGGIEIDDTSDGLTLSNPN